MELEQALAERYSCRSFRPDEVPGETLERLFSLAQRTPSWCNTQPWQVHLVSGPAIGRFAKTMTDHVLANAQRSDLEMPAGYSGVYAERRRESGYGLYAALGIERDDKLGRGAQALLNYSFFGAPHVAVVTTDREQGVYGAIDCGGYVTTLALAAHSLGLATVPQAAIAMFSDCVRDFLDLPEDRLVVCAVSLGFADEAHPANAFRTSRAPVGEVVVHVRD